MPSRRVGAGIARRDPSGRDGVGREGGRASPPRERPRYVRRGSRRTSGRRGFVRPGRGPSGARLASSRPWMRSRTTRCLSRTGPVAGSDALHRSATTSPRSPRGADRHQGTDIPRADARARATHPAGNAERAGAEETDGRDPATSRAFITRRKLAETSVGGGRGRSMRARGVVMSYTRRGTPADATVGPHTHYPLHSFIPLTRRSPTQLAS